jgi:deazaflavin-dependent oxidoreductase (nitroreductase family)
MPAPRWLARFNLHVTNRILGPLAARVPGMGVVVHVGRKSGRAYRTPVIVFRQGNRFVIALTYGRESEWVRNVLARGGCEFETRGQTLRLTSPYLYHDEKRRALPGFIRGMLSLMNVSDFLELAVQESELANGHHGEESGQQNARRRSA